MEHLALSTPIATLSVEGQFLVAERHQVNSSWLQLVTCLFDLLTLNCLASGTFASGTTSGASPFGSQPAVPAVSPPTFASPSSTGFGAFGQSQPAFGGAATFGGSPLFGNKPTFGGGATFGSPVAGIATATPKPETGTYDIVL